MRQSWHEQSSEDTPHGTCYWRQVEVTQNKQSQGQPIHVDC